MKRFGIINVNLEYEIPENLDAEAFLNNVELPKEYVSGSFEIIKIVDENDIEVDGELEWRKPMFDSGEKK